MPKKDYPYQNFSLKDMKGEEWEDVPGLDGYFQVSNLGRIKRLEYETQYKNGAIYIKPEKIMKPIIIKAKNRYKGDYIPFLTIRMCLSGKRYSFTIARLVYRCFVDPKFNMENLKAVILTRDNDNFNIRPSNLVAATLGQKQSRAFQRNRTISPLLLISEELKDSIRKKIIRNRSKQVSQYKLSGRKIRTFSSAAEAERATGIHATAIGDVALGKSVTAGGFLWRRGKSKRLDTDVKKIREDRYIKNKKNYKLLSVTQYDMTGNRIASYPSLTDAEEATGINAGHISLVTRGVYKSAQGFFWTRGYGKEKINLSDHKWGTSTRVRQVTQYTLKGKKLKVFPSIKAASLATNTRTSLINAVLKGTSLKSGKFIWRYGDGLDQLDLTDYWEKGRREAALKRRKPVTQYNLRGERIAVYSGICEASLETGIRHNLISSCVQGKINSAGGFIWRKGYGPKKVSTRDIMFREKFFASNRKRVAQFSLKNKFIKIYEGVSKAAVFTGIPSTGISAAARGKYSSSHGYIWKYV